MTVMTSRPGRQEAPCMWCGFGPQLRLRRAGGEENRSVGTTCVGIPAPGKPHGQPDQVAPPDDNGRHVCESRSPPRWQRGCYHGCFLRSGPAPLPVCAPIVTPRSAQRPLRRPAAGPPSRSSARKNRLVAASQVRSRRPCGFGQISQTCRAGAGITGGPGGRLQRPRLPGAEACSTQSLGAPGAHPTASLPP